MRDVIKIVGGFALIWFGILRGASALVVGIKSWSFRGVDVESGNIGITLNFMIKNPLLVGVTIKGVQGDVYVQGQQVGKVNMAYNYYLTGGHTHILPVVVTLNMAQLGQAAITNIQSGNVQSLTIGFDGKVIAGKANIPVPVQVDYNWGELTK